MSGFLSMGLILCYLRSSLMPALNVPKCQRKVRAGEMALNSRRNKVRNSVQLRNETWHKATRQWVKELCHFDLNTGKECKLNFQRSRGVYLLAKM